jgi:trimeric autotransporter adhesin
VYEQTYYISAICGNNVGGHVSQVDPCYSQSIGTPVIWFENPVAHITETEMSTCGLRCNSCCDSSKFNGMTGSWSSGSSFVPIGGTTINDPTIEVLAATFGNVVFTWTVYNGVCAGSDNITVHFEQTPVAYAGEDFSICGNEADLNAVFSITGSIGQWTGPGSFMSASSAETTVTSSIGCTSLYMARITWRLLGR